MEDNDPLLADNLGIPRLNTLPFADWVSRVRGFPAERKSENPAAQLIGFLDEHFIRMSCGGLVLDTENARSRSKTLASVGPVSAELVHKYIESWKAMGFLKR